MKVIKLIKKNSFLHICKDDNKILTIRNIKVDNEIMYLEFDYDEDFVFFDGKTYAKLKGITTFERGRPADDQLSYNDFNQKQKNLNHKIANILKTSREKAGLEIQDVRKEIGVSYPYINKLEKGETRITKENIEALAKIYKTDLSECLKLLTKIEKSGTK